MMEDFVISKVHFEYERCSIEEMNQLLSFLNEFYKEIYKRFNKNVDKDIRINFKSNPPLIHKMYSGSIWTEVVIPVACALAPIVYDIIKECIKKARCKNISTSNDGSTININKNHFRNKKSWQQKDEEIFVKKTNDEYVKKQRNTTPEVFITKLPFDLLLKYGQNSLLYKIYNHKALLDKYRINNSLNSKSLSHYSNRHEQLFRKVNGI